MHACLHATLTPAASIHDESLSQARSISFQCVIVGEGQRRVECTSVAAVGTCIEVVGRQYRKGEISSGELCRGVECYGWIRAAVVRSIGIVMRH